MLHLLPGPRRSSKKRQAGFHRRIILEAIDVDSIGKSIPAVVLNKLYDDGFQRDSIQGVIGLLGIHA